MNGLVGQKEKQQKKIVIDYNHGMKEQADWKQNYNSSFWCY